MNRPAAPAVQLAIESYFKGTAKLTIAMAYWIGLYRAGEHSSCCRLVQLGWPLRVDGGGAVVAVLIGPFAPCKHRQPLLLGRRGVWRQRRGQRDQPLCPLVRRQRETTLFTIAAI